MCVITRKSKIKTFTGYKAVLKIGYEYYSPSTGYCYKLGSLPELKTRLSNADNEWKNPFSYHFYKEQMIGKTGVFKTLKDIKGTFSNKKPYDIIKLTIGGNMYEGRMDGTAIIIGSEILKIEPTRYKTKR